MARTKVLLLSSDISRFVRVTPVLEREGIEIHRMLRGDAALKLTKTVRFDVILVADPLADLGYLDFLKAARDQDSSCRTSGIVLLLPPDTMESREKLQERGANRVLSIDCDDAMLQQALSDLLGIALRAKVRAMLQVQLMVGPAKRRLMCQTENLSKSGFLVKASGSYAIGTTFDFELKLPSTVMPVRGTAEIVRHASWPRERLEGFGARFISFVGNGREQLDQYLACPSTG